MTDNNVVKFYPKNAADKPDAVLEQSVGEFGGGLVVIGWDNDEEFDIRASTDLTTAEINLLLDMSKARVMDEIRKE